MSDRAADISDHFATATVTNDTRDLVLRIYRAEDGRWMIQNARKVDDLNCADVQALSSLVNSWCDNLCTRHG